MELSLEALGEGPEELLGRVGAAIGQRADPLVGGERREEEEREAFEDLWA